MAAVASRCPSCAAAGVLVTSPSAPAALSYRCPSCGYSWSEDLSWLQFRPVVEPEKEDGGDEGK